MKRRRRSPITATGWLLVYTLLAFLTGILLWYASPNRGARPTERAAVRLLGSGQGVDRPAAHLPRYTRTGKSNTSIYGPALLCRCGGATIYRRTA